MMLFLASPLSSLVKCNMHLPGGGKYSFNVAGGEKPK